MVDHIELGGEVLALDFSTLLCAHCREKIEAAKDAQRALQKLNALSGGGMKALPPPAAPAVPGVLLGRQERLEKAKGLLRQGQPPAGAAQTSNGTILAHPWQHLPRVELKKRAENDLSKVADGRMKKSAWCKKHGHSPALLEKRLSMLGVAVGGNKRTPVNYTPPKEQITQDQYDLLLSGGISGNRLAKQLNLPTGTVYRLAEKEKLRRQHERAAQTRTERASDGRRLNHKGKPYKRRPPGELVIDDQELQDVYDGKVSQASIAQRLSCNASLVNRRYDEWMARNRLEPKRRAGFTPPSIDIDERDLIAFINGHTKAVTLAEKYGCSAGLISLKAKTYALRYGIADAASDDDEDKPEEGAAESAEGAEKPIFDGLQRILAD